MIIGVTGPIGSGKGRVAEFFKEKGFIHHSFSMTIRQVAKERGVEVNRVSLQKLGDTLRKESKDSILGQRILETIKKEFDKGASRWVIEGMRDTSELKMFREHEFDNKKMRFVLVYVDAPQEIRFERVKERGRKGEPETFEEFKKLDDKEINGDIGQEVGKLKDMAEYIIINDKGLKELDKKIDDLAKDII